MAEWPQEFEELLAEHLELEPGSTIDPDVPLNSAGLNSMAMVGLMLSLEEEFDIELPESDMTVEAFYSAATLWAAVRPHLPAGPVPAGGPVTHEPRS